jgi:hypothetical protein
MPGAPRYHLAEPPAPGEDLPGDTARTGGDAMCYTGRDIVLLWSRTRKMV